jgi:polyisoprenoid-binding protein YceI
VSGDLTVHGVTKPITAKLEKTGAGGPCSKEILGLETTFTIAAAISA